MDDLEAALAAAQKDVAPAAPGASAVQAPQGDLDAALAAAQAPTVAAAPVVAPATGKTKKESGQINPLDIAGGLAETLTGGVLGVAGALSGAASGWADRLRGGSYEHAGEMANRANQAISTVGGLYTGPETQTGQAIQDLTAPAMQWLGAKTQELSQMIADARGTPDAATLIHATLGGLAAAAGGPLAAKGAEAIAGGATKVIGGIKSAASDAAADLAQARAGTTAKPVAAEPGALAGGGAAVANPNQWGPLTGEDISRGPFRVVKLSRIGEDVSPAEQATRAAIMKSVMPDADMVRTGVVTGNENALRSEQTLARAPGETGGIAGAIAKSQYADEQNAFNARAQDLVDNTGTRTINPDTSGDIIKSTLSGKDGMTGAANSAIKTAYNGVMSEGAAVPAQATGLQAVLNDPVFQAELKRQGLDSLGSGTADLLKTTMTTGFKDAPAGSVAALERLRQSNNAAMAKDGSNAWAIKQMNAAIDGDIDAAAKASGSPDLIANIGIARSMHRALKTVTGAEGIRNLIGEYDETTGTLNRGQTSVEKIPQKVNDAPTDQWHHLWNTAGELSQGRIGGVDFGEAVTPELRARALQMQQEMSGNLMKELQQAGGGRNGEWLPNAFTNVANAPGRITKYKTALPFDQLRALHNLNDAGQIAPGTHAYEGAAMQSLRANELGLWEHAEKAGTAAGASLGGAIAGPPGAMAGGWLGSKAGSKGAEWVLEKKVQAQADALRSQWQKNAKAK